jgi:transposase
LASFLSLDVDELFHPPDPAPLAERNAQIASDYKAGVLMGELVQRYNLDRSVLGRIIDAQGIDRRRGPDEATLDLLAERYQRGDTGPDIAETYGVPRSNVYYWLERRGVARRPSWLAGGRPNTQEERICTRCGRPFTCRAASRQQYHSRACAKRAWWESCLEAEKWEKVRNVLSGRARQTLGGRIGSRWPPAPGGRPRGRPLLTASPELIAEIRKLAAGGWGRRAIANRLKVSERLVRNVLDA